MPTADCQGFLTAKQSTFKRLVYFSLKPELKIFHNRIWANLPDVSSHCALRVLPMPFSGWLSATITSPGDRTGSPAHGVQTATVEMAQHMARVCVGMTDNILDRGKQRKPAC